MQRFVAITDIHMAQRHNRYRSNVGEDIIAKVRYAYALAESMQADLLCAGDWFHSVDASWSSVRMLGESLNRHTAVLGVAGQHDMPDHGYWWNGPAHPLTWISNIEIAGCPDGNTLAAWSDSEYESHVHSIVGLPFGSSQTETILGDLIIVHDMLVPKPVPWPHVLLEDFATRFPDDGVKRLVFSGDYHAGYKPTWIGNTLFCNPGALTRISRDDANRIPQAAVITYDAHTWEVEYVEVPHRKDVFDMTGYGEESLVALDSEFAAKLSELGVSEAEALNNLDGLGLEPAVKQAIEEALASARSKLGYT